MVVVNRAQQKSETRKRLVRVAHNVFSEKGFVGTRTVDVARSARVAHGTVFAHFPTREALLVAVIEHVAQGIIVRLRQLMAAGAGVREVLAAHLEGLAEHESFYFRLVVEQHLLPPSARLTLMSIQSVISAHLAEAAKREIAEGRLRPVPLYLLFNTWLGLIHHYVSNRDLFAPDGSVLRRWGPVLLDHYMGLVAP